MLYFLIPSILITCLAFRCGAKAEYELSHGNDLIAIPFLFLAMGFMALASFICIAGVFATPSPLPLG